jgi:hypothetical protein
MKPSLLLRLAACAPLFAACAGTPGQGQLADVRGQHNPTDRAQRTITNFTPALRCMDDLLFRNGTRDVTLMMEELRDATQKVPLGARDMMTSAISDMTRRSRAVTLSVFGGDQQNLAQLLQQAQKTSAFAVVPEFAIRGSISQIDEDVKKEGASFGTLAALFGVRVGTETRFSAVGFDAAVARTESLSLVHGVTSKNTTIIARRDASAGDGQARLLGANTVFAFQSARSEGGAQAVRNMIELAAIELVGKLTHSPYWQCLGTSDDDPEVQREVEDWFVGMTDDERTVFLKERLRERRWYDGALDAARTPDFERALTQYRAAMVPPASGPIDPAFFRRFVAERVAPGPLAAPRPRAAAAGSFSAPAAAAPAGSAAVASAPIEMRVQPARQGVQIEVTASTPGYVYCYAQDPASHRIRRVFPNRFMRDPRIEASAPLALPGKGRFVLAPSHEYACVHAPREVYGDLPPPLRWGDFEDIRLPSFDEIRQRFADASGQPVSLARPARR